MNENSGNEKTVEDVFNTLTEEQKTVVYAIIGQALESNGNGGNENMKHNVFDNEQNQNEGVLSHSDMETIISDAKRYGSLKESFLAHTNDYGIENIEYLFPDAKNINTQPDFIRYKYCTRTFWIISTNTININKMSNYSFRISNIITVIITVECNAATLARTL